MFAAAAGNEDGCRLCQRSSLNRRRTRYPRVTVTLLLVLMIVMLCCCSRITVAAVHQSDAVAMVADDAVVWKASDSVDNGASLSSLEDVGHGQLASLPHRDRDRRSALGWRALIALRRPPLGRAGPDGAAGGRATALVQSEVVNKANPAPATKAAVAAARMLGVAGVKPPAAESGRVNVTSVITTLRGHHGDRLPQNQITPTFSHSPSSISTVLHAQYACFQWPGKTYSVASVASSSMTQDRASAASFKRVSSDSVRSNSSQWNPSDSDNKTVAQNTATDDTKTFMDISDKSAGQKPSQGRVFRRLRRQSRTESVDDVRQQTPRSATLNLLDVTTASTEEMSSENSTAQLTTSEATGSAVGVPLGYRSRGNFAALVDPLKIGRASSSAGSAPANRWRQLATVGDNSTSSSPITAQETTPDSATTSSYDISADSDSIEVKVLKMDSAAAENSTSVASQPLNESSKSADSTLAPSGEWKCSNATKGVGLQTALKSRLSASAAAACIYMLSFLFTLVAASAITGLVFSLCVRRNRRSSSPLAGGRRLSSQLVLGLLALAASARALHYVAAEYQPMAAVATPGGRRAIYECWFPVLLAAFFVQQQLHSCDAATNGGDLISPERGHRIERFSHIRLRCDLCIFGVAFCCYFTLVLSLCLMIEFCVVFVETVFVLRIVFVLFVVLLSAANVHRIATSSGRRVATQVVLCALFVICAGFSAVDAAALLSSDFALLLKQNSDILVAVEAAKRLAELFTSIVLCAQSSTVFSRFQCQESLKNTAGGRKKVARTTRIDGGKGTGFRKSSTLPAKSRQMRQCWLNDLLDCSSKTKVVDVGSASLRVVHGVGWASTEAPGNGVSPLPLPPAPRMTRTRSMLYNDHGFIRFRLDGDTTDGESDARTLDDDDGSGPGQARSVAASEYASAGDLSSRCGPSSTGTPRWSRPGSPSLAGFRAPSIHLQDSIDRALDRCDIWRVGFEQGQLSVDELRRIVQLYADISDVRRGRHQRRTTATTSIKYAEV